MPSANGELAGGGKANVYLFRRVSPTLREVGGAARPRHTPLMPTDLPLRGAATLFFRDAYFGHAVNGL